MHLRAQLHIRTHACISAEIGTGEKQHTRKSIFHLNDKKKTMQQEAAAVAAATHIRCACNANDSAAH